MYYDLSTVLDKMRNSDQIKFILPLKINYKCYFTTATNTAIFKIPPDKENLESMFSALFDNNLVFDVGSMSDNVYYSIRYNETGERYVSCFPACINYYNDFKYSMNTFEQSAVNLVGILNIV